MKLCLSLQPRKVYIFGDWAGSSSLVETSMADQRPSISGLRMGTAWRFHRNTLWRYLAGLHLRYSLASREQATSLPWVSDVVGAGCATYLSKGLWRRVGSMFSPFAVIPEIDAYVPQVALASTIFSPSTKRRVWMLSSRFGTPHAGSDS